MNAMIGLLVPALLGVDFGWQRKTDGSIEYIVQVDAATFAEMQHSGIEIGSAVPPSLRPHLSALTFRVGTDRLPNADTLPTEVQTPQLNGAGESATTASTSNYQPPGSPGGTNAWAAPTTANWPASPTNIPSSSSTSSGSTSSQGWPAPPTTSGPVSTSGFPINPNAVPTPVPTSSTFPGSTSTSTPSLGTLPSSSSGGAWPVTTAPPSMSVGPRVAQPQTWNSQPREVSISARMPTDPTLTQTNSGATPNYNYQQPTQQQPYPQQPGAYPSYGQGQTQYAQAGYPPTATPAPTGYANPAPFQQPTGLPPPQGMPQQQGQQQPPLQQQPQQVPPGMMVAQNGQLVPIPTSNQRPIEPASASDKAVVTSRADDSKWLPFTFVLILLLTSGACNLYFGWSTYQLRERYRMLMGDRGVYT